MSLSAWSIRNPIPAVMLFVLLTLAGLLSFRAMRVQNFPDMDLPIVMVTAVLPGAAPGQLESDVARKIENAIATTQGLKHITTTLTDGVASIAAHKATMACASSYCSLPSSVTQYGASLRSSTEAMRCSRSRSASG